MDWKEEIENSLVAKGMHRVKYLNDNLVEYCKEYVKYLNEFNGINATEKIGSMVDTEYKYHPNFEVNGSRIIKIGGLGSGGIIGLGDFTLYCYFDWKRNLCLKYPIDLDGTNFQKKVVYGIELITEPERFEKDFIFQVFNKKVKQYIEMIDNHKSSR